MVAVFSGSVNRGQGRQCASIFPLIAFKETSSPRGETGIYFSMCLFYRPLEECRVEPFRGPSPNDYTKKASGYEKPQRECLHCSL